ncbi:LuxR C-terminal-related transcriptional regulator [Micromonospora sp. DT227]
MVIAALQGLPRLSSQDTRVYALAAERSAIGLEELCVETGMTAEEAQSSVERLCALQLMRSLSPTFSHLTVVPPDSARAQLLDAATQVINEGQRTVDRIRSDIDTLASVYEASAASRESRQVIEVLADEQAVSRMLLSQAARAVREVMIAQPGSVQPEATIRDHQAMTHRLRERGVVVRALYHHTARFEASTGYHLTQLQHAGAEVRTYSEGMSAMLVFDDQAAMIGLRDNPAGMLLVREPSMAAFVRRTFDQAWSDATALPARSNRDDVARTSDDIKSTILRLLAEGLEDRVIAQRLGMSLRSYQRHMSQIMARLGAHNRLHAGYLIGRDGLV